MLQEAGAVKLDACLDAFLVTSFLLLMLRFLMMIFVLRNPKSLLLYLLFYATDAYDSELVLNVLELLLSNLVLPCDDLLDYEQILP